MASARRIVLDLCTTVRNCRGITQWARTEMASARRIDLWKAGIPKREMASARTITAVKQWSGINKRDLSTNTHHDDDYFREIGYTDVADLLSTPERDFLVRIHNGERVPLSSLKGKIVGLYVCERVPQPHGNRMQAIKEVYEEAKSRGLDFEIVQMTFDFNTKDFDTNPIIQPVREDIPWLTLSSKDPSYRKIQQIFQCVDEDSGYWGGDSLVLIYPPQAEAEADDSGDILFEFSGAQLLELWGIQGYPFKRKSLYKAEYELQKREVTLQSFFPPGECLLRPGGFDRVDALSQLSGKRVLVLFASHSFGHHVFGGNFLSMLRSEYQAQLEDNVAEESQFEVVYVSTGLGDSSSFDEFTKDMPWWVQPFKPLYSDARLLKAFKPGPNGSAAVAFNEQGELIAKEDNLYRKGADNPQFPFIDQDLEKRIRLEVEVLCTICI